MAERATTEVALLRGINVGGKNRVAMRDLVALFESLGCTGVRTYIQSGNLVYRASAALRKGLGARASEAIERELGLRVPVVTRGAKELAKVLERNPFLARGADEKALHVVFLRERPKPTNVKALDPDRSPPDEFAVDGSEVFLHCPNGMARTKLTSQYLDSRLDTIGTARNWATVKQLVELCG